MGWIQCRRPGNLSTFLLLRGLLSREAEITDRGNEVSEPELDFTQEGLSFPGVRKLKLGFYVGEKRLRRLDVDVLKFLNVEAWG